MKNFITNLRFFLALVVSITNFADAQESLKSLSTGMNFACAVTEPGSLWCWGNNSVGQLGSDDKKSVLKPSRVAFFRDKVVEDVSASQGSHACAITTDGLLWCWGNNGSGQLGVGSNSPQPLPVLVKTLQNERVVQVIAANLNTCVRTAKKEVWCWGQSDQGQVGDGIQGYQALPQRLTFSGSPVKTLAFSGTNGFVTLEDGSIWTWGQNTYSQLGLGDSFPRFYPVKFNSLKVTGDLEFALGLLNTCLRVKSGNRIWCWGYGNSGQLGPLNFTTNLPPTRIGVLEQLQERSEIRKIILTQNKTFAFDAMGSVWLLGTAGAYDLVRGYSIGALFLRPMLVYSSQEDSLNGEKLVDLIASSQSSTHCGLFEKSEIRYARCWAGNEGGKLGTGDELPWGAEAGQSISNAPILSFVDDANVGIFGGPLK